ncbi:MAG: potassium channel family protein [Dehalococcoidia bacterium]|nr:potassium channel family protein [Dehalococcoidia bacterium]
MNSIAVRLLIILAVLLPIILGGAAGFMALEDLSFGDALYFTIVTVSTVGYGDIHPVTAGGKALAVVFIIVGVTTFLAVTANAVQILLQRRQEQIRRQRLDMLVGVFFSEIGTRLLQILSGCDVKMDEVREELLVEHDWSDEDYARVNKWLGQHAYTIDPARLELRTLKDFLTGKSEILLRLLENPNLLEHESFTDLLMAISHMKEELLARPEPMVVQEPDAEHLANDAKRAYILLTKQWLSYMLYLKKDYPYLFSLALRTNPFCKNASPYVT